jgi:putative intracellular protease/amidase
MIGLMLAAGAAAAAYLILPLLVRSIGLHRTYRGPVYRMPARSRALIVTTSHHELGRSGRKTGVFSSELTAPYYAFADAGMKVDIASIKGGTIPFDPMSFLWFIRARSDDRGRRDRAYVAKTQNSLRIGDVDVAAYDIIFLAGGWGAAYDLGSSKVLGERITQAWRLGKVVGGVCHGPLGLLQAHDENGAPLVRGRRLTAVTDRQIQQLRITETPQHPERDLRASGALFESRSRRLEILADHVVRDGKLVTGQNQNSGEATAQVMMQAAGGLEQPH